MAIFSKLVTARTWPIFAIVFSASILAIVHASERFGGLPPCPLCLRQREIYWALIAMIATGLVLRRIKPTRRFLTALNIMIGLVFVTGAIIAGYHTGVEWDIFPPPTGCSTGPGVDPLQMTDLNQSFDMPACTEAPFYFIGLSMAGWNMAVSAFMAILSFVAAGRLKPHAL